MPVIAARGRNRPYDPDPQRTHTPASDIGAEWYGSADDICRVHAALQASAVGAAAPLKQILSAIPGIDIDRAKWPFMTLHDVMRPIGDVRSVVPDAPLANALELMSRDNLNQLPVVSNGHLEGMLSRAQVLTYLQTRAELRG